MVIIKYYEWFLIEEIILKEKGMKPEIRGIVYELCDDNGKKIRKISKEEAIRLIEENHLMRERNENGAIWR